METAVNIGATVSKESAQHLAMVIEKIFRVGFQTRMEQDTIRAALSAMSSALSVQGTTLTGCNIQGDKTVNV